MIRKHEQPFAGCGIYFAVTALLKQYHYGNSTKNNPHLWFSTNAEEAVNYYVSVFKDSGINKVTCYGKEGFDYHHMPEGTVLTISFHIAGQKFLALNGGPVFRFTEAISFIVNCDTQEEIDYYWEKLSQGGDKNAQQCGWLKDKFRLSWQVAPTIMEKLLGSEANEKTERMMRAMFQMKKLDIKKLQEAYDAEPVL